MIKNNKIKLINISGHLISLLFLLIFIRSLLYINKVRELVSATLFNNDDSFLLFISLSAYIIFSIFLFFQIKRIVNLKINKIISYYIKKESVEKYKIINDPLKISIIDISQESTQKTTSINGITNHSWKFVSEVKFKTSDGYKFKARINEMEYYDLINSKKCYLIIESHFNSDFKKIADNYIIVNEYDDIIYNKYDL